MISTKTINLGYVGEVSGYKGDMKGLIKCMDTDNVAPVNNVDLMETHITERINKDTYLIYTKNGTSRIYKQLPLVYDDDTFKWEEREYRTKGGYKYMFAKVDKGMFRFCCTAVTETGNGRINVYMLSNLRSNGLINTINITEESADNEAFTDAINKYIEEFVNLVMYHNDVPNGSNYKVV